MIYVVFGLLMVSFWLICLSVCVFKLRIRISRLLCFFLLIGVSDVVVLSLSLVICILLLILSMFGFLNLLKRIGRLLFV